MTTQITINEYDSAQDGGPDAPQARFEVTVHIDGTAPSTEWTNDLRYVMHVVQEAYET